MGNTTIYCDSLNMEGSHLRQITYFLGKANVFNEFNNDDWLFDCTAAITWTEANNLLRPFACCLRIK
jgi:hypothetical protein